MWWPARTEGEPESIHAQTGIQLIRGRVDGTPERFRCSQFAREHASAIEIESTGTFGSVRSKVEKVASGAHTWGTFIERGVDRRERHGLLSVRPISRDTVQVVVVAISRLAQGGGPRIALSLRFAGPQAIGGKVEHAAIEREGWAVLVLIGVDGRAQILGFVPACAISVRHPEVKSALAAGAIGIEVD